MKGYKSLLAVVLGASLFIAGCGEKKISMSESSVVTGSAPVVSAVPTIPEEDDKDQNFLKVNETINTVADDGKKYTTEININYELKPEEISFDLVSYTPLEFNEDTKERIVKGVFGDNEVYSGDEEDWPASKYVDLIRNCEEAIAGLPAGDDDIEVLTDKINFYSEKLKSAPEGRTPISDYNHTYFVGHIEGIDKEYAVVFRKIPVAGGEEVEHLWIGVSCNIPYYGEWEDIEYDNYSNDEATLILNNVLKNAGLAQMEVIKEYPDGGKLFSYEGINKMSFENFKITTIARFKNHQLVNLEGYEPFEKIEVHTDVEHISLDEVKNILLDIAKHNPGEYFKPNNTGYITLDSIRFGYVCDDVEGEHYLVPSWIVGEQVAINAIDGTYSKYTQ